MTLAETVVTLNKYALLYPTIELTDLTLKLWAELFSEVPVADFDKAMTAAVKEPGRTWFPSPGEVQKYIEKVSYPPILAISSEQAFQLLGKSDNPLIARAGEFALKAAPRDTAQYSSPEELAKANAIRDAVFKREFKARFEKNQDAVKTLASLGMSYEQALLQSDLFEPTGEVQVELLRAVGLKAIKAS